LTKVTIDSSHKAAHCHSGNMGRGLAGSLRPALLWHGHRTPRARATRCQHTPARGHRGLAQDLVRRSPACRRWNHGTNGRKMDYRAQPSHRYTGTYSRWLGRGSSPERGSARWKLGSERMKNSTGWTDGLGTESFCCKDKRNI
jgi:hypothetical protein